jgi:hypothetical protein
MIPGRVLLEVYGAHVDVHTVHAALRLALAERCLDSTRLPPPRPPGDRRLCARLTWVTVRFVFVNRRRSPSVSHAPAGGSDPLRVRITKNATFKT